MSLIEHLSGAVGTIMPKTSIKVFGRKIYCRLLKFMNHDVSTGQKHL